MDTTKVQELQAKIERQADVITKLEMSRQELRGQVARLEAALVKSYEARARAIDRIEEALRAEAK